MTECTPFAVRGKVIVALQMMYVLGRTWLILLGMVFLDNLHEGNWRAMALMNAIPCFICMMGSYFYLEESGRFLVCCGDFGEGVKVITKMGVENVGPDFEITA